MNFCNCPDCKTDNCPAAVDDNFNQHMLALQCEATADAETRVTMWRQLADNLAVLVYASGCGISTKTMLDYEKAKQQAKEEPK